MPASSYVRTATYVLQGQRTTRLEKIYASVAAHHPGQSGFHLVFRGSEAFTLRIARVEASERSIDMQYFSSADDQTGKLLLAAVARAADRGVRVRILLDNWYLDDFAADAMAFDHHHSNVEIRIFNPYALRDQTVFFLYRKPVCYTTADQPSYAQQGNDCG